MGNEFFNKVTHDRHSFMASLNSHQKRQNFTTNTILSIIILLQLHILLCPVSCFNPPQPSIPPRDLLYEEKIRLGSIHPTCHNKCNQCHPCMVVEVPTSPSHDHVQPGTIEEEGFFLQGNNRYPNYKPLSWKCHCGGHFFIP